VVSKSPAAPTPRAEEEVHSLLPSGRRLACGALVLAIIGVVVSSCVKFQAGDAAVVEQSPQRVHPTTSPCQAAPTREQCSSVKVDGRAVRYALYRAPVATQETLLVDVGGPGVAVLSGLEGLGALAQALGPSGAKFNLLFIEEPWVTASMPRKCDDALSGYYRVVRSGASDVTSEARRLIDDCGVGQGRWGFSRASLVSSLEAIKSSEKITVRRFLGFSFGSVRWSYLHGPDWLSSILVRPFPLGVPGDRIIAARVTALEQDTVAPAAPRAAGVVVEGRSLPVTAFDLASARVQMSYLPPEQRDRVARLMSQGKGHKAAGQLSDRLWGRFGKERLAPSMLAYLDEVCQASSWPASRVGVSPGSVLAALTAPCRWVPGVRPDREPTLRPPEVGRLCVVVGDSDPVVPGALMEQELTPLPDRTTLLKVPERDHTAVSGLQECLERTGT